MKKSQATNLDGENMYEKDYQGVMSEELRDRIFNEIEDMVKNNSEEELIEKLLKSADDLNVFLHALVNLADNKKVIMIGKDVRPVLEYISNFFKDRMHSCQEKGFSKEDESSYMILMYIILWARINNLKSAIIRSIYGK